jgi:hypothetical protein
MAPAQRGRRQRVAVWSAPPLTVTTKRWDDAAMPRDARTVAKYVLAVLALAAMLVLAPFYFASGLMAPGWAVGIFITVWLVLFGLGCFWIRRKPLWVLPLPFLAAAFWLGGMNAGATWLGWTA